MKAARDPSIGRVNSLAGVDRIAAAVMCTSVAMMLAAQSRPHVPALLVLVAFVLVLAPDRSSVVERQSVVPVMVVWAGVVLGAAFLVAWVVTDDVTAFGSRWVMLVSVGALVVAGLGSTLRRARPSRATALLGLLVAGSVLFVLGTSMDVLTDVELFQQRGVEVLLADGDPYESGIFVDPYLTDPRYGQEASDQFYGPGVSEGGVLQFGYPYTPLGLLLAIPAVLLGELRLLHVTALLVAAAAIASLAGRGRLAHAAPLLVLITPAAGVLVGNTWNDGLVAALLLLVVVAWDRGRFAAADVLMGLVLATKQYALVLVPFYLVLAGRRPGGSMAASVVRVAAAAAVFALPFLVRNPEGFLWSTVALQFVQPFRPDSMSVLYLVWPDPPLWSGLLSFVGVAVVTVVMLRRSSHDTAGLLHGWVLVAMGFFLLAKQSFLNYHVVGHILLVGLLVVRDRGATSGAATTSPERPSTSTDGL